MGSFWGGPRPFSGGHSEVASRVLPSAVRSTPVAMDVDTVEKQVEVDGEDVDSRNKKKDNDKNTTEGPTMAGAAQPGATETQRRTVEQTCQVAPLSPPGLTTASSSTAVQPQTVQDPLHTGLTQTIQTASSNDNTNHHQNSQPSTAASTTALSYDPQRMYEYYIEDELTRNGELIMAAHSTRTTGRTQIPTWHTVSTATETSHIRALLAALAFDLGNTDPWNMLGLSRLEGPKPNMHMLQSRRDVALKIIDSCTLALHDTAQQEITTVKANLNKACDECCANLDTNTHERRNLKGGNRNIPRWMEPSEDLFEFLSTQMPRNGRLALHLSNLRRTDIAIHQGTVDVNTSKQLHSQLCGPLEEIERTLARWGDQPLLTWAPTDNGQLLKIATCIRNLHTKGVPHAHLTLAIPFDPYPACQKVSDITDIWDHPLLQTKWKDIVVDTTLLTPPTRIVVAGTHAPIHAHKCIALFTLGQAQTPCVPNIKAWRPTFFSFATGPTIAIDTPLQCRHTVKAVVDALGLPALQSIDNPRPSLGSTKDAPRTSLQLHFEPGKITPMHMETLLKWLSITLHDFQAIVGVQSTMASPTAMLVDVMSPAAGHTHGSLCWSTLVISPRLLLVETRTDATTWSTSLTSSWDHNPNTSGIKIRYRPSTNTKPLFAQVQATTADIAAVRARRSHSHSQPTLSNPPTLQATITMPLGTRGPLEQWLPIFMQKVATTNNLPLQASTTEHGLDIYKWKAVSNYEGAWSGKVLVQLANTDELHRMRRTLHGHSIEVQQHVAGIFVDSDHIDLSSQATGAAARST